MSDKEKPALTPAQLEAARAENWMVGSIMQLRRKWSGRCVTCAHWQPTAKGKLGACDYLDASKEGLVDLPSHGTALTAPEFGCVLWKEIPPKTVAFVTEHHGTIQREVSGPMRERTDFAIDRGILPALPKADAA